MSYTIEFKAKDQMCLKRISLLKEEPTLVHEPRMVHAQGGSPGNLGHNAIAGADYHILM